MSSQNFEEIELSEAELWERAESLARGALGVDAQKAFKRLAAGDLDGTILESKLSALAWLLRLDEPAAAE